MKLKLKGIENKTSTWRLNEDTEVEKTIKNEIEQYFQLNETPEVAKATIWEAHKAYIRGKLISMGTRKTKERTRHMEKMIKEIYKLEQMPKKGLDVKIQQILIIKRDQLKDLME